LWRPDNGNNRRSGYHHRHLIARKRAPVKANQQADHEASHDDLDTWTRQRTFALTFELADSGRYEDFTDIAYALQFERGVAAAHALFDDPDLRRELNRRCERARESLAPVEAAVVAEPVIEISQAVNEDAFNAPSPVSSSAPSLLRRAAALLWRTGGLRSAAS
jgi:hypothetical protein